ncbi:rod shape-determining protein RodA [Thermaurantiacus tibetensis]|uniref:rod shape-determining protein RodA n=1 Tax=Thermaurantiacus tibetensis TaxID=2759035 RepID=UPI00188FB290|nr:rod shape-determining protein RodA [Thermaurantiacus tibetensis]
MGLLNARWPQRLLAQPWGIILLVLGIGGFGALVLYSAAGGSMEPWAASHLIRLAAMTLLMLLVGLVPPAAWLHLAFPLYGLVLAALVLVEAVGALGGGSQRWLDLGFIRLQPSELMKLALVLALARVYRFLPLAHAGRPHGLWLPLLLVALPVGLVLLQPDLGTALTLVAGGATVMFLAGLPVWLFVAPLVLGAAALPLFFNLLHDYQKARVLIFLDPGADPLGAGYHITQSKIAIGSGGLAGKGFLEGSQSHLFYLPEPHTDFIFATMAEEWGLVGGAALLAAYGLLFAWGWRVAFRARDMFQRLVAGGLVMTIFYYVLINLMMVMGLAPVVGLPLPLMSYGGNAMLTVMPALGILIAIDQEARRHEAPRALGDP